jgi:5-methyltetrahydrofolate--homocysteine methyltransferase
MNGPLERIQAGEILCGDGGWGTQLMARGLKPGDSPEALNLSNPEALVEVATLYVEAGAQLITTNTFGGSSLKLKAYDLDGQTEEINAAAITTLKPVTVISMARPRRSTPPRSRRSNP